MQCWQSKKRSCWQTVRRTRVMRLLKAATMKKPWHIMQGLSNTIISIIHTHHSICYWEVGLTLFYLWSCDVLSSFFFIIIHFDCKTDQSGYWEGMFGGGLPAGVCPCFQQWLHTITELKQRSNCRTGTRPSATARRCWRWSQPMPKVSLSPQEQDRKCPIHKRLWTVPFLDY